MADNTSKQYYDRELILSEFEMDEGCLLEPEYDSAIIGVDVEHYFVAYDYEKLLDLMIPAYGREGAEKMIPDKETEMRIIVRKSGVEDGMLLCEPRKDLDPAIKWKTMSGRGVYDYQFLVEGFMKGGMTEEEASEWISYNVLRSFPYFPDHSFIITTEEE